MSGRKYLLVALATAMCLTVPLVSGLAQPLRIRRDSYRVRVVNQLGLSVRVGLIGYRKEANARIDLAHGSHYDAELYAGQRVVVAWDRDENIVFASDVIVDQSGTLRLGPMEFADPAPGEPAAAQPRASSRGPLPRMRIEN